MAQRIPFKKPCTSGKDLDYISQAATQGKIASEGQFTRLCDSLLEKTFGIAKFLLTPSSTAASDSSRFVRHWLTLACLLAGMLLAGVPLFYLGLHGGIISDHDDHVRLAQRGIEYGAWPVHFLFPVLIYGLSGFSHDAVSLARAALVLLAACIVAKTCLTYVLLVRRCPRLPTATFEDSMGISHATLLVLVTAALLLSAPIVRPWRTGHVYLGQVSPNVWHNPTSLLCWPLVLLLFFSADDFLRSGRRRTMVAVASLSALSVLAKPNYFLAFAPIYALLGVLRFGVSRVWFVSQAALIPTVLLLCWQLVGSFDGADAMRPGKHIAWMPLVAWHEYSSSIGLSLLFSLAFPLSYLIVFRRSLRNRGLILFAWGVMLSALVWTACFAEVNDLDGAVERDFNFSWGAHLSIFVLFLVTAMDLTDNSAAMSPAGEDPSAGRFVRLPWWLLGAHAASGVYWIVRQVIGKGFG